MSENRWGMVTRLPLAHQLHNKEGAGLYKNETRTTLTAGFQWV
ncbi:hypothetical protein [Mangrovibacter plantisponsor]|nr:hypothetical protein [Mangrovibacter plantisponsor]